MQAPSFSLCSRQEVVVGDIPFAGDRFKRAKFARALSNYVNRMNFGAVLAIDAKWGYGKTWFGKNWQAQLKLDGHPVVYIDAFEQDYVDDPFVLIAAEIATLVAPSVTSTKFVRSATAAAKALAPLAVKTLLQASSKILLGSATIGEDFKKALEQSSEDTADVFEKIVEDRIAGFNRDKGILAEFRLNLQTYAQSSSKPTVVIVDELDRCRPDFAVSLLERIKHFFNVENVIFVLLINKIQFGQAVRGVYGADTDAHAYLDKFLNFTFTFPRSNGPDELRNFAAAQFDSYDMGAAGDIECAKRWFYSLALSFKLSPRQVQRAVALLAIASPIDKNGHLLAYLAVLKTARPEQYARMLAGDRSAHDALLAEVRRLNPVRGANGEGEDHELDFAEAFHAIWVNSGDALLIERHFRANECKLPQISRLVNELAETLNVLID